MRHMLILLGNRQGKQKRGRQPSDPYAFSARVGMARCAVPARAVAGGTNILATPAIERVAPLHAARTSQRDVPTMRNTCSDSAEAASRFSENGCVSENQGTAACLPRRSALRRKQAASAALAGGVGGWTFNVQGLPQQNANEAEGVALSDSLSSLRSFAAKSIMADRRDALSYGALDELRNSAILLIAATSKI